MTMLHDNEHFCKHCDKKVPHIHYCTSVEESKLYTCEFCGTEKVNHRHICKEKLKQIKFFCINCGAVAVSEMHLCNPAPVGEKMKEQWDKVADKTGSDVLDSCRVCGQPVSPPGHFCDPKYPYICEYCGEKVEQGYHFCKDRIGKCRFECKTCGRISIDAKGVCAPFRFREDDE